MSRVTSGWCLVPQIGAAPACAGRFSYSLWYMSTPANALSIMENITKATEEIKKKLEELHRQPDQISISQMFEMQMLMNRLSQLSEMSSSVLAASNSAIASMARNVKS